MNKEPKHPKELNNQQEIISHLSHAALKQLMAHIWKRNYEGQIWINEKVKILKLVENSQIRVEFKSNIQLSINDEVLFALEGGTLVFKSLVQEIAGKVVILALPTLAKGIERRRSPRKKYKYEDRVDFEVEFALPNTIYRTTAYLLDLSQHGICLSLSDETVKKLELEKEIILIRTNEGVTTTKCTVRSIRIFRPAKLGRNALYAVGMEFVPAA